MLLLHGTDCGFNLVHRSSPKINFVQRPQQYSSVLPALSTTTYYNAHSGELQPNNDDHSFVYDELQPKQFRTTQPNISSGIRLTRWFLSLPFTSVDPVRIQMTGSIFYPSEVSIDLLNLSWRRSVHTDRNVELSTTGSFQNTLIRYLVPQRSPNYDQFMEIFPVFWPNKFTQ